MITEVKYQYGNKTIPFDEDNIFVDFVDNVHDLKYFEELLGEDNFTVYSTEHKYGGSINYIFKYCWALVTTQEKLTEHYNQFMRGGHVYCKS